MVEQILERVEQKLGEGEVKATLGDYIRLVQLQKELEEEEPGEITVTMGGSGEDAESRKTARHKVQPAAIAAEVSRFGGAVQGVFGADRLGKEPGAVPGSDQAELPESGADGADRSADLSDAAGCDGGGAAGGSGTQQDSARAEQGGKLRGDAGDEVEDFVPGGGGVREVAREQPGVVRPGRTDVHGRAGLAAAGRAVAGSRRRRGLCGFAVWTPKGYDWVYERFVARKIEGYETVMAAPFENRYLLERVPDYYERLRGSYDERFFQAGGAGRVSESAGRAGCITRSSGDGNVAETEVDPSAAAAVGAGFQRGSDVLGGGADGGRQGEGAG